MRIGRLIRRPRERTIPTYSMDASTSRRHGATRAKPGRDIARDRRVAILCADAQGSMLMAARSPTTRREYVRSLFSFNQLISRCRVTTSQPPFILVLVHHARASGAYARCMDFVRDVSGVSGTCPILCICGPDSIFVQRSSYPCSVDRI